MPVQLRGAAGHQDLRRGAAAVRVTDRLARLAHRFVGHGAAVDDDPVLACRSRARDRLAFSEVEPAAEGDSLDAHCRASRSSSPSNTCVAPPRIRMGWPGAQSIVRLPPVMSTRTGDLARFVAMAATALAHAPVPHARVSPAPRSNVRSLRRSWT